MTGFLLHFLQKKKWLIEERPWKENNELFVAEDENVSGQKMLVLKCQRQGGVISRDSICAGLFTTGGEMERHRRNDYSSGKTNKEEDYFEACKTTSTAVPLMRMDTVIQQFVS